MDKVSDGFEVRRQSSALRREGNVLANELEGTAGPDAEGRRISKLNRLGCDDQLDGDDSLAELHHLGEPAGGERGERHPIFDPLGLGRAGELERNRLRKQPCLRRQGMACVAKLGEPVLVKPGASGEAVGKTGERPLQELHQALVR
jgi:hypothetical protein